MTCLTLIVRTGELPNREADHGVREDHGTQGASRPSTFVVYRWASACRSPSAASRGSQASCWRTLSGRHIWRMVEAGEAEWSGEEDGGNREPARQHGPHAREHSSWKKAGRMERSGRRADVIATSTSAASVKRWSANP